MRPPQCFEPNENYCNILYRSRQWSVRLHGFEGALLVVVHQGAMQFEEFRPEGVVHKKMIQTRNGETALAVVLLGADTFSAQQIHEQAARPLYPKL